MTTDAHQLAGLGYTEEERYADYLKRAREIELKTAEMNETRRHVDDLKRTQADEEKAIKSWLKLQPEKRKAITIDTEDGELEIGAMLKVDERETIDVFLGGMKLRKAIEKSDLGDEFLAPNAFPAKRGRKPDGEPAAQDDGRSLEERLTSDDAGAAADPLSANGKGKAGRPPWSPPAAPDPAFDAAWEGSKPSPATEKEALEQARAHNAERRKAAAQKMRDAQEAAKAAPEPVA